MKKFALTLVSVLIVTSFALATPLANKPGNPARQGKETTVVGYISDGSCGLKHMDGMGDDKSCTLTCVKGGSQFVLADRDHQVVYRLDSAGQEKAREFAGQKEILLSHSFECIRVI